MKKYFQVFISLTIGLLFAPFSIVMGQEHEEHNAEFSKLLEGENKQDFFISSKSGSFESNFGDVKRLESHANDIWIKVDNNIVIESSRLDEYGTILIEGTLTISETGDYPLKAQKIIVAPSGKLTIGTNEQPIDKNKNVEITFVKNQPGEVGIFVFGELSIHGYNIGDTFVELTSDANPGQEILAVTKLIKNWERHSKILITSPGIHKNFETCTEENDIDRIDGVFLHLKKPLVCFHQGLNNDEISSHVAKLDRNIVIKSDDKKNRGSVNFFYGSKGDVKYTEFQDLGPKNVLGRYPIHFHHMQDSSIGMEVTGNSIIDSENRWITIHDSNGILIKNNLGYNSVGHGFFLEDGNEFENVFDKNIGINSKPGSLISSDAQASVFWTMNPQNTYKNNVAVEGWYYGFHISIPNMKVDVPGVDKKINLRSLPNSEFDNNSAYNNNVAGLKIIRNVVPDESLDSSSYTISNMKIWNQFRTNLNQWGIYLNADDVNVKNAKIFDSPIGIEIKRNGNLIEDAHIKITQQNVKDSLISGIILSGQENTIRDSVIEGYLPNDVSHPSDISISNSHEDLKEISGYIFDTALLDKNPIHFGNPKNPNSFLQVYGYRAPNGPNNDYPENFELQSIKVDSISDDEILDYNFFAKIKPITRNSDLKFDDYFENKNYDNYESNKIFKSSAIGWANGMISDKKFSEEVLILIEKEFIELHSVDLDNLHDYDFVLPSWQKRVVNFWANDSITDEEYFDNIEYVLQSKANLVIFESDY